MKKDEAVCDAGPLIHLAEIGRGDCFSVFDRVFVPEPVFHELEDTAASGSFGRRKRLVRTVRTQKADKVAMEYIALRFSVSVADASVIVVAGSKKKRTVLTDDLDLREVARARGLTPVGSIGILLRAYRWGILTRREALSALDDLMSGSSLFITPSLIKKAKNAVTGFRR